MTTKHSSILGIRNHRHFVTTRKNKKVETAKVNWVVYDTYVFMSVLGTHASPVVGLDAASCKEMGIHTSQPILLPFETRRARIEQIPQFCLDVLNRVSSMTAAQMLYITELLDLDVKKVAFSTGVSEETLMENLNSDEPYAYEVSFELADYFYEEWEMKYNIHDVRCIPEAS